MHGPRLRRGNGHNRRQDKNIGEIAPFSSTN
jgi:hypothetical protein